MRGDDNMYESTIKDIVKEFHDSVNHKYPQYADYTETSFGIIEEMLAVDYSGYSSDAKRIRCFKSYLRDLISNSFFNGGVKNYLKLIVEFFQIEEIKDFFKHSLNTEYQNYLRSIDVLKSNIIYWQGFEGHEEKKLVQLLNSIPE